MTSRWRQAHEWRADVTNALFVAINKPALPGVQHVVSPGTTPQHHCAPAGSQPGAMVCDKGQAVGKSWDTKFLVRKIIFPTGLKSALFWDFTQRRMVVSYRRFGITYRFHLQGSIFLDLWPLKFEPTGSSDRREQTTFPHYFFDCLTREDGTGSSCRNVGNKLSSPTLRKNPQEYSSRPHRGGSLKYDRIARRTANDVFVESPMRLNPEVQRRCVCVHQVYCPYVWWVGQMRQLEWDTPICFVWGSCGVWWQLEWNTPICFVWDIPGLFHLHRW